jgi:hypothetical protein
MGNVVAQAIMSLDGYVAKQDNTIGRLFDWLQNGEVEIPTPDTCPACQGTGYQPIPPGYGRHWPPSCPTCHRLREVPRFSVQITRPHAARTSSTAPKSRPAAG